MLNFACRTKEEHLQVIDFVIFFLYILTTITSNNYLQLDQISSYCLYMKNKVENKIENQTKTCAVCFRQIKVLKNQIADHGFNMVGFRNNKCFGSRYLPFETSKKRTQQYLVHLRNRYNEMKNLETVDGNNKLARMFRAEKSAIYCNTKITIRKLKGYKQQKENA